MFTPTVPTEEDWKVEKRGEKQYDCTARKVPDSVPRSTGWNQNPPNPSQLSRQLALPGARRLRLRGYPFAGMVTGFASLNVTLL